MKEFLKNGGIIIAIIGIIILGIAQFSGSNNNLLLGISAILIVIGFFSYILVNKMIED